MLIGWRKFTFDNWRFRYALLFGTFCCLVSLLTIALPNYHVFEDLDSGTQPDTPDVGSPLAINHEAGKLASSSPEKIPSTRIDVDLKKQKLSIIDGSGKVTKVLPISSGSGKWYFSEGAKRLAVTPTGSFTVYRKIPGWRKSPLGMLYYPVYINGGVAIHGSASVPRRPASHGCIRIPMSAAAAFYKATPVGTVVTVHK